MVNQKIKKPSTTLTGLVLSLIIVIALFSGLYLWMKWNVEDAGNTVDTKYSEAYANLSETSTSLQENVDAIKTNVQNIKEADSTWQVAWNGLKGLGNTMKLPINFITTGLEISNIMDYQLDYIPAWLKALVIAGIVIVVVLLIAANLKGEPRM